MKSIIKKKWTKKSNDNYITFVIANCSKCLKEQTVRLGNWNRKKDNYICRSCSSLVGNTKRSGDRLYNIYNLMLRRAENTKQKRTKKEDIYYSGITICEEWLDFDVFREWSMSNGYKDNLTIDRKDNNNGYYPENCRWVTQAVQMQNQGLSISNTSGLKGVCFDKARNKWIARLQSNGNVWQKRYETKEDAINGRNNKIREWKTEHNIQ